MKLLIFAVLLLTPIYGDVASTVFTFDLEKPFGNSWYDLEHAGADTTINGNTFTPTIRSELNFPLDHFRLALGLTSFRPMYADETLYLRTNAKLWSSVSPAFSKMRDEDWSGQNTSGKLSNSQLLLKFSDTYSSAKSFLIGGELSRELMEVHFLREPLILGLGLGGAFLTYDIFGLSGKQLQPDNDSVWVNVGLPNSLNVGSYLTYDVQSSVSLRTREPILGLYWETWFHPLIFAHSLDDHMLRKKKITMNCLGTGGAIEASLPLKYWDRSPSPVSRLVPYIRAELNRTWGSMTQTYYANSPDTPGDETGQSINGISTTVDSWLVAGGAHINFNL